MQTLRTMIVPAALVEQVRSLAIALAGDAAAGMWTTGLSPDGSVPPTHYVSSGYIEEQFSAVIASPEALAAAAQIPIPAAAAILAGCVISDGPPMAVIAEAGLQLAEEAPI
jgi:hypothetical protein